MIPEISFTSYHDKSCAAQYDHWILSTLASDDSGYYDNCKTWWVTRSDCDGFVVGSGQCYFADEHCRKSGLSFTSQTTVYLKEVD